MSGQHTTGAGGGIDTGRCSDQVERDGPTISDPAVATSTGISIPKPPETTAQIEGQNPTRLDDATLAARARDGDTAAFEMLLDRYQGPIFRLAVRMLSSRTEAEDLTQEVFLTAWRRLPELREDAAFVGWLYRTATNRCLNVLRSRRFTVELDPDTAALPESGQQPERAAENAAASRALSCALQHLTPAQRACWLLREVHGRTYEEIAHILGITPVAVRGRLARARADLAEAMQPWR